MQNKPLNVQMKPLPDLKAELRKSAAHEYTEDEEQIICV
jgi:hypothetical protein